jgi:PAS domain S-box-containing protein
VSQKERRAGTGVLPDATTLRSLIEQVPVTVYIDRLDDISSNVFMSPQLEAVLGYSAEEWASDREHFLKVVHPEDRERVLAEHRRTRETGDMFSMEYRMLARDGSVRWFLDEARVVRDETGRPVFHHGFLLDITERKKLEEALHRSEDELRREKQYVESLLEISPVAVVTLDLDEQVTSWNPAAEALFGYSEAGALGRTIQDLILRTETLYEEGVSIMNEAMAEGAAHRITRRMRKDGTLVDVEMLVVPLRSDGETIGSYAIYHDVSELHRQKQYYESLLEISPTAIITVDLDGAITSWNPAAEKLFGYSRDEALGRRVDELVAAADEVRAEAADVNRLGSQGEVELITRRTRKDGSLVDVHVLVAPVLLEGEVVGRYGIYHDISELQRQKQRFQALLDDSPTAIAAVDLRDTITAWNPAAEKLFEYTREEAVGRNIDELVANSPDIAAEAAELNKQARDEGHVHVITRRTRRDGSLVDVEVLVTPLLLGGEMEGFYAIYHDIGELMRARREAEDAAQTIRAQAEELAEWNRTLNARVDEQVEEIERMSKLRRFLTPQVADAILAAGADSVLESHRSEITAVFCDLRGFTHFAEVNEPEDVMRVLREYHGAMGEIIFEYGATLEHFEGDGMMLFFNDPIPVADPTNRAVRMAIAMRDRAAELTDAWRRHGHDLGFGVGVARGYATLGRIGFEGRFDYAAVGSVVNMASRLGNAAAAGQILVSLRVFAEVEDVIDAEPAGELEMKGFHGPQQVFNVIGIKAPRADVEALQRDSGAAAARLGSDG